MPTDVPSDGGVPMVGSCNPRNVVSALAFVLAAAGVLVSPTATARPKAPADTTLSLRSPLLDIRLSDDVSARAPTRPAILAYAPAGARFFTINQVLARIDTGGAALPPRPDGGEAGEAFVDAAMPRSSDDEPFGLASFRAPEGALWGKWRILEAQLRTDMAAVAGCRTAPDSCTPAAARFLAIVEVAQAHDGRTRLTGVNSAVNAAVRYTTDYARHGSADHWSAPLATLSAGEGDCEDYAIAKYAALRAAGVADDDLRLVLVRDIVSRQDHAVLAARHDGSWLVMDNRWNTLGDPAALTRFMPLFALDHRGVKLFAAPYVGRPQHESEDEFAPAGDAAAIGGTTLQLLM